MRIVLLGSDGFLGRELASRLLVTGNEVLLVGRRGNSDSNYISTRDANYLDQIARFSPEIVINTFAAWGSQQSKINILDANLIKPLEIITTLAQQEITWIQCNSYYNYTYDEIGIDRDDYSLYRRHFTEIASEISSHNRLRIIEIRLPHLVGVKQPSDKIIPLLVSSLKFQLQTDLGSGNQVIPLLHVSDAARQIIWIASNRGIYSTKKCLFASIPVTQLSIKQIVEQLEYLAGSTGNFRFGLVDDRIHEVYSETKFTGKEILLEQPTLNSVETTFLEYIELYGAANEKD